MVSRVSLVISRHASAVINKFNKEIIIGAEANKRMYRERGIGGSKSEVVVGQIDRKRINDALDKQLERSSPSTSRGRNTGKFIVRSGGQDHLLRALDTVVPPKPKDNASDGKIPTSIDSIKTS